MRGEIEVIVGDKTVYKDSNMVVDSAGSLLADIMTVPRAYEDIPSASSILDTSNYTIQAISFGKGTGGYLKNSHELLEEKIKYFISNPNPVIVTTKQQSDVNSSITSSILWGTDSLPDSPNPFNKKLNLNCLVSSTTFNLIQDPNNFVGPDSSWQFFQDCTGTSNTYTAPDGTLTADTIFSNGGDPFTDNIKRDVSIFPSKGSVEYKYSVYMRKDYTNLYNSKTIVYFMVNSGSVVKEQIEFTTFLDTGAVTVTEGQTFSQGPSTYTKDNIRVTSVGDYWLVEVLGFKDYSGKSDQFRIRHYPGEAEGVAQNLTLWGSKLDTTYSIYPIFLNNLYSIQDPNDFANPKSAFPLSTWKLADQCTGNSNTHIAPDGTLTADTVFSNGENPLTDNVFQNVTIPSLHRAVYNYSIYLRKDDTYPVRSEHIIYLINLTGGETINERINFKINLNTGASEVTAFASVGALGYTEDNIRVTSVGDYWFVEVLGFTDYAGTCDQFRIRHYPGESSLYPGEGQALTLWGANLNLIPPFTEVQDFGHNLNLIPSAIHSQVFDGSSISIALAGSILGCWPEGQSQGGTPCYVFSSIEDNQFGINPDSNLEFSSGVYDASSGYFAQSGTLYGYFNEASSMDYSGYVNMIMSSVPNGSYSVSDSSGGLILSASPDFSSTGMIEYECTMASGDAVAAQLYGGIYNMGLWAMDVNAALRSGYTPPLSFDVINNQKRYKLFCRKDLTTSLTQYQDTYGLVSPFAGNHYPATSPAAEKVTIKWRIYFL